MHARMLRKLVGDVNAYPVAFNGFDRWPRRLTVIAPKVRNHPVGKLALDRLSHEVKFLHPAIHAVRKGPAVERYDGIVIRPGRGTRSNCCLGTVHLGRFWQAHVCGLAPSLRGDERRSCSAGPEQLTSIDHVIFLSVSCAATGGK